MKGKSSYGTNARSIWPQIWKLKIGNADRTFLWRASLEALPTKVSFSKIKVVDNANYPICLDCPETAEHALWSCISAQDAWGQSSRRIQKSLIKRSSFKEVLECVFTYLTIEETSEFAMVAYELQRRRYAYAFGVDLIHPSTLVAQSKKNLEDFKEVFHKSPH